MVLFGEYPLDQVIDLLALVAPRDRQRAGPPEPLHRHLGDRGHGEPGGLGIDARPVETCLLGFEVARLERSLLADPVQNAIDILLGDATEIAFVARMDLVVPEALEEMPPVGEDVAGENSGVVGPVLEQRAGHLDPVIEPLLFVASIAREEDLVLCSLDRRDGVDLDETEPPHHSVDPFRRGGRGRRRQRIVLEQRPEPVQADQCAAECPVRKQGMRFGQGGSEYSIGRREGLRAWNASGSRGRVHPV